METHECPACGLRFRHAHPNACTACSRVHCRNCLKVFRDEVEEEPEGRFIVLCPECEDSISWRVDAQEVSASNWSEYGGRFSHEAKMRDASCRRHEEGLSYTLFLPEWRNW